MTSEEEKIQKIIRLKRHEQPRKGYFEDFIGEFRARRGRREKAKASSGWLGSLVPSSWSGKTPGWLVGGGLAYAALVVALVWWPGDSPGGVDENRQPVIYQPEGEGTKTPGPGKDSAPQPGFRTFRPE